MRYRVLIFSVAATALVLSGATARADEIGLDWKVRRVNPTSKLVYEGPTTVDCQWTATIAKSGSWEEAIQWSGMVSVDGQPVQLFQRSYAPSQASYIKPGTNEYKSDIQKKADRALGYDFTQGTATNEFDGSVHVTVSLSRGTHKIGCMVAMTGSNTHEKSSNLSNNTKEITVEVQALKQLTPGEFPSYQAPKTLTPLADKLPSSRRPLAAQPPGRGNVKRGPPLIATDGTTVSIRNQPAGGERVKAMTPVIVPLAKIPTVSVPNILTPRWPFPGSNIDGRAQANRGGSARLRLPSGQTDVLKPRVFRPGEKLLLQDGRSLMRQGSTLVLLDPQGRVQRFFPPNAEVFVGAAGDVSVRTGAAKEAVGTIR